MYDNFRTRMAAQGRYIGEVLKNQSDMIMNATFTNDIAYRKCWIQCKDTIFPEQTLDGYKKAKAVFSGKDVYNPSRLSGFRPIDAKYLIHTYTTINADNVDYFIQFRPTEHGKNPNIRVGALIFVPDDLGVYNLWMIVQRDDRPQFPQFYILKCNLLLKWLVEEKDWPMFEGKHVDVGTIFSWAVQRTQSSYNSGVWTDYVSTRTENQLKAIVSTNSDTNTIVYNERFVISENPLRRVSWEVSKCETTTTFGLTKLTFTQELEHDDIDNVSWINLESNNFSDTQTGIDYDFYKARENDNSAHESNMSSKTDSSMIYYSGVRPVMKIGGSYKTFTAGLVKYGNVVQNRPYWKIEYYNSDDLVCTIKFTYVNDELVCDNEDNDFVVTDNKISYFDGKNQLLGLQYMYDMDKPMELKLKCMPVLNMIGGELVLTVDDDPSEWVTAPASIRVGVEGL